MSLHDGIDTVAFISLGVYTETYGDGDGANIATLYASLGMLETANEAQIIMFGGGSVFVYFFED